MKNISLIFILIFSLAEASDIKKWVDEKGNVHYGDRPPVGKNTEKVEVDGDSKNAIKRDNDFLLGKWRTDPVKFNGQTIPSMIYVFEKTSFSVQGKTEKSETPTYSYNNGTIIVVIGVFSQKYTIMNDNTVSYRASGFGRLLLHRIK